MDDTLCFSSQPMTNVYVCVSRISETLIHPQNRSCTFATHDPFGNHPAMATFEYIAKSYYKKAVTDRGGDELLALSTSLHLQLPSCISSSLSGAQLFKVLRFSAPHIGRITVNIEFPSPSDGTLLTEGDFEWLRLIFENVSGVGRTRRWNT